jgi:hypothetical protein
MRITPAKLGYISIMVGMAVAHCIIGWKWPCRILICHTETTGVAAVWPNDMQGFGE